MNSALYCPRLGLQRPSTQMLLWIFAVPSQPHLDALTSQTYQDRTKLPITITFIPCSHCISKTRNPDITFSLALNHQFNSPFFFFFAHSSSHRSRQPSMSFFLMANTAPPVLTADMAVPAVAVLSHLSRLLSAGECAPFSITCGETLHLAVVCSCLLFPSIT